MTPERWAQVNQLFHAALEHEPNERSNFLAQACGGDEPLRAEVDSLIASHAESDSFIETSAADIAADVLAGIPGKFAVGHTIGNYEILELLGFGGMGEVYLAADKRLGRRVALKVLPPHFSIQPDRVRRIEWEARAVSALNHPNIVTIHEIGETDSSHFIATEYIEGETLRSSLARQRMTLGQALDIAVQVASALAAAHEAGIVHRDIKPENVMIRPDGYVKVLDFGLAKLVQSDKQSLLGFEDAIVKRNQTARGVILGTVNYMSPEQAKGEEVDQRSDIFSLGVMLYEMIAGQTPFAGNSPPETLANLINAEPKPIAAANVPDELKRIVSITLRKNKDERYQTMKDVLKALKNLEVEALKLSLSTDANGRGARTQNGGQATFETVQKPAASTAENARAGTTSKIQYLVNGIARHRLGPALAAALVLAVVVGAFYFYPARGGEAIDSVAVLPFVNVNNDPKTEYLSDGISDSIINSLSRVSTLRVMSLNAVLRFKGKQNDAQTVGKVLNVNAVLIGRVTQEGDNLVISTELIDVRDNRRLWGEQYNRRLSDILLVQNEIAQEISDRLRLKLTGEEKQQLAKQYTANPEAYKLYTLGNYYFRQNTKEGLEKSIELYEQALKIDSNYALAYAALARAYHYMGTRGFWPAKESEQKVEWAALKALQLDDALAEGHSFLAIIKINKFDWAGAEKELKRALELDPNSDRVNGAYWSYLTSTGRVDEALQLSLRTQERDSTTHPGELAFSYFITRQYDKTIELYRMRIEKKTDTPVTHIFLGETYLAKGMIEEGLAETQKGIALDDTLDKTPERWDRYPMLAYAYAVAGRRREALKILDEQKKLAEQRYVSPYNFAIIYTGLGDEDRAFEYLTKAVDEHVRLIAREIKVRPRFDSLRSDPRYPLLLRRMNLEP